MKTAVLLAALCVIATSVASWSQSVTGKVTQVGNDGRITLDGQVNFFLWGLAPVDTGAFRAIMLNRNLQCTEILYGMDCLLFPRDETAVAQPLHALTWLPELGLARLACVREVVISDAGTGDGFTMGTYACRGGVPSFPPQGLLKISYRDFKRLLARRAGKATAP